MWELWHDNLAGLFSYVSSTFLYLSEPLIQAIDPSLFNPTVFETNRCHHYYLFSASVLFKGLIGTLTGLRYARETRIPTWSITAARRRCLLPEHNAFHLGMMLKCCSRRNKRSPLSRTLHRYSYRGFWEARIWQNTQRTWFSIFLTLVAWIGYFRPEHGIPRQKLYVTPGMYGKPPKLYVSIFVI